MFPAYEWLVSDVESKYITDQLQVSVKVRISLVLDKVLKELVLLQCLVGVKVDQPAKVVCRPDIDKLVPFLASDLVVFVQNGI